MLRAYYAQFFPELTKLLSIAAWPKTNAKHLRLATYKRNITTKTSTAIATTTSTADHLQEQ
jgi:hypothetical protein